MYVKRDELSRQNCLLTFDKSGVYCEQVDRQCSTGDRAMTTETRQAIAEMRKRGYDGEGIIVIARLNTIGGGTPAQALVQHVKHTPNTRHCPSCHGTHFVQQCPEIKFWMRADDAAFDNFARENGL